MDYLANRPGSGHDFATFRHLKDALLLADNTVRNQALMRAAQTSEKKAIRTVAPRKTTYSIPVNPNPPPTTKPKARPSMPDADKTCFKCGGGGHWAKDCKLTEQNEAGRKAQQAARIHEIDADSDCSDGHEPSHVASDSDSESENE